MSANSDLFVSRLHALTDIDTDDDLVTRLYDLCYLVEDDVDAPEVIPHIFAFLEAHPDADFGAKGPLAHFLEKQPDYEKYLIESMTRRPTAQCVWMVNAILNSPLLPEKRGSLLGLLASVETHPMLKSMRAIRQRIS